MGITWENLNINFSVPGCVTSSFVKVFDLGENICLIGVHEKLTEIALLDSSTLELRWPPDKLILDVKCKDVLAVSGAVYAVDCKDNLYRLISRVPEGFRKNEDFRDDGKNKYFWEKVHCFSNVIAITGLSSSIMAIEESRGSYCLTAYNVKNEYVPMILVELGKRPGRYFITSLGTTQLDSSLMRCLLSERSTTFSDVVIFSKPSGWVCLFPVICEFQKVQPIEIHFENNNQKLVAASFTGDGKNLILAYESGKIVIVFADESTAAHCVKNFYLRSELRTVISTGCSKEIVIISSDASTALKLATISDRSSFKVRPAGRALYGVRFLLFINELRPFLAFTCFGGLYKLVFDGVHDEIVLSPSEIVQDISNVGVKNEKLTRNLGRVNNELYAIENEQFEKYCFEITTNGGEVQIKNCSPRVFIKSIWRLRIAGTYNCETLVKMVRLEKDYEPENCIIGDISNLAENGCNKFEISLVGNIGYGNRSLLISVGSVSIGDVETQDVKLFVDDKLSEMFQNRRNLLK